VRGRLDPLAGIVDASVGVDGADDGVGSGRDVHGALDDVAEGEAELAVAQREETGGVSVAVEGASGDFVIAGDVAGRVPVDEVFFDGLALGMAADSAVAGVMGGGMVIGNPSVPRTHPGRRGRAPPRASAPALVVLGIAGFGESFEGSGEGCGLAGENLRRAGIWRGIGRASGRLSGREPWVGARLVNDLDVDGAAVVGVEREIGDAGASGGWLVASRHFYGSFGGLKTAAAPRLTLALCEEEIRTGFV
jgi:hypothetical protein